MDMSVLFDRIDAKEEFMRKAWNLEGFTIGIVKDGKMIGCRGYGKKNAEAPCDAETMMPIGSATKSFTALLLAMLADEGKLTWDTRVREVLPGLKLWEESTADNVTVRDLLCHRTGLAGHELHSVYCVPESRAEAVEQLQYLQPGYTFREGFKYSNQGVMLAGAVAEAVTGKSWETLVSERILQPLGMTRTNMSIAELEQVENRSVGYIFNGTESMAQPYLPLKAVAPAGSLNSTAEDMMKYMLFQLGDGTVNGTRLVSRENLEEMHRPQVNGSPYMWQLEEVTETTYGLCWFTDKYRGRTMLSHGGNTLGFSALMTLLPCEDLGIIILTNGTSNFLPYALTYEILDEVLGVDNADGSPSPWTGKMGAAIGGVFAAMGAAAQAKAAAKVADAAPAHALEAYVGTYKAPGFGTFSVSCENGQLLLDLNGYKGMLLHYHYEYFDAAMQVYGMVFPVCFHTGMMGNVDGLEAFTEGTPGVKPVFFAKEA